MLEVLDVAAHTRAHIAFFIPNPEGGEIGRAQALQARAAGIAPSLASASIPVGVGPKVPRARKRAAAACPGSTWEGGAAGAEADDAPSQLARASASSSAAAVGSGLEGGMSSAG